MANKQIITKDDIRQITAKDDLHIAPFREDGKTYGTPTWIWNVAVHDELYVRAYNGKKSRWYQSAIKQKTGKIEAVGKIFEVRFEPVNGKINDEIDEAYRKKYGGNPYLDSMISESARLATIKIR